ncbi:amino acid permease [Bifidobacterium psychraerophilum]|uniref:Amino acid permease n=1 Tax=Bifidobacterium psychraerophilum TaxID=218140 RepID=A0A087CI16_9BIFI|nr:amino acid permease [Bifidobacterium psychraerophilum]KFI82916.1 amino acid permease [Bifidobacterium psychraerophilum]PKA94664.1 amino acid/polyamine/organocation transporter (APC superfamily) [Bifidobacterium psychraerophilum DSM 22366]
MVESDDRDTTKRSIGSIEQDDDARKELRRTLKNRHIQLIALGGAIGTGLFYGSSESISLAGPSILLAYLIGGGIIFLIVRALGEMSVEDPKAGAFSYYASRYWSQRAGFISGWNYWFNYVLVSMVELSVVGSFVNYWFPSIPAWLSAAVFLVVITGVNLLGVSRFGEFEFWFAIIKIVAVLAMIAGGVAVLLLGLHTLSGVPASFANWFTVDGGVLPHGLLSRTGDGQWSGLLMALTVVMFSFGGTELIGITAGEAADPRRSIPKATNDIIWRILLFYIGALGIIMAVVPWNSIGVPNAHGVVVSPFVQIFDSVGIHAAAGILNIVCLTAVMSVYNSGLYANSRMLFSLARQGNAPTYLARLSRNGVPTAGVLTSAAITAVAVVIVFLWPDFAFNYLMSIATIAGIINWSIIMITESKFRRHVSAGEGPGELAGIRGEDALGRIRFKLPWPRITPWIVLVFLALVVVLMCFSPSYRVAVIIGPLWLLSLLCAFEFRRRRHSMRTPKI